MSSCLVTPGAHGVRVCGTYVSDSGSSTRRGMVWGSEGRNTWGSLDCTVVRSWVSDLDRIPPTVLVERSGTDDKGCITPPRDPPTFRSHGVQLDPVRGTSLPRVER